ncbi:NF-kappa-B inhibitor cactus isoform X3 [Rhodnius prolixus]|uniref:NF-kappa-B inhibitor cactus isoform X3 n=1 Tax=Rhodnius prolixus TaxID=13249 RepID=UPI003D18B623
MLNVGLADTAALSSQTNKVQECSEGWSSKKESTDCSLYDSGRTDSGFLSGANIVSEEIPVSSPEKGDKESAVSYIRLDSGVDVGLSDQLSDLCIDEESPCEELKKDKRIAETKVAEDSVPWELYFQQDDDGDTQLHIAIIQGCVEVVYNLIRMVPSSRFLDIRNDMRQATLHLAVLTSHPRIIRRLVCAGACTKSVDRNGNTALHLATAAGDVNCVRALTEPINPSEVAAAQLRYRPTPRQPQPPELDLYNYEGLTCVHLSVMRREIPILRHLSNIGANVDARECKSGRTALHMAAEIRDTELGSLLLREFRANPHILDYSGKTPYHLARHDRTFIMILLSSGASYETDFSSDSDYDSDSDTELMVQMHERFRDLHTNGIVNATA